MDFVTRGNGKYSEMYLLLRCCMDEKFEYPVVSDRFRILFIQEGAGVLNIDENRLIFNAPAVFCIDETEKVRLLENKAVKAASVYFHPCAINSALDFSRLRGDRNGMSLTERNDCTCLSPFYCRSEKFHGQLAVGLTQFRQMMQNLKNLADELDRQADDFWPCRSRSFLIEILFLLQKIYLSPNATNEILLNNNSDFVGQVMLFLHTNYERKITIEEISRRFNINRTTLNERFRAEIGMSAIAYLIDLRIRLACMILSDTLIPVSEIAERVGFSDITHFNRTFRKIMMCTPSEYRQAYSWQLRS
jgi:AraC-like DNA-binding protein